MRTTLHKFETPVKHIYEKKFELNLVSDFAFLFSKYSLLSALLKLTLEITFLILEE
jgi:hypothetical protein